MKPAKCCLSVSRKWTMRSRAAALRSARVMRSARAVRADATPPVAALFAAGILSRLAGPVLWCLHSRDLFAPALARVGLHPDRVIYCETWKDAEILPSMEEGLRHPGVAGAVGELNRLPLTPSRRLQLAAEPSKVTALVVRRSSASEQEPNAATSRWQVSSMASVDQAIGMGRARWHVELLR